MGLTASPLYYQDSYLSQFDAHTTSVSDDGLLVTLDRTAFYPTSGGQLHDTGTLNSIPVLEVTEHEGSILHRLAAPLSPGAVHGEIDFARRFDFMQQHSGQHLLSAVFEARFGFKTLSVHMGESASTVDLDTPSISPDQLRQAEEAVNRAAAENHPISIGFEDSAEATGLRKATEREGSLRIVSIDGIDRSACGGTHVRSTGEIGPILLRRTEKIRSSTRVEFLCGLRALRRARLDYEALNAAALVFNAALDDLPALAASAAEQLKESEKARRKLALEFASIEGRRLFDSAPVSASSARVHLEPPRSAPLDDELRAVALAFTESGPAIFFASSSQPPSVLLAVSESSGLHAGNLLKPLLAAHGGRGGGSARTAQGSLPTAEAAEAIRAGLPL